MHVTERRFEIPGGSLTLKLETEHPLDEGEREALERIAADCQRYADRGGPGRRADAIATAGDELGGEERLTAGKRPRRLASGGRPGRQGGVELGAGGRVGTWT